VKPIDQDSPPAAEIAAALSGLRPSARAKASAVLALLTAAVCERTPCPTNPALVDALGISETAVRDTLVKLVARGLVRIERSGGFRRAAVGNRWTEWSVLGARDGVGGARKHADVAPSDDPPPETTTPNPRRVAKPAWRLSETDALRLRRRNLSLIQEFGDDLKNMPEHISELRANYETLFYLPSP